MGPGTTQRRLAAILSADVAGYGRLMAEDESSTVAALEAVRGQIGPLLARHSGRLVDFTGDNFLVEFATATDAVGCGLAIQQLMHTRNKDALGARKLEFRMGIHVGEVRVEEERLYGSGVNIAARLEQMADSAGICISSVVLEQIRRQPGLAFDDLGPQQLKNIPDPVQAYRVRSTDAPPPAATVGASGEPSIAVLAFVNMSADPDQEYFADGMAEELINALAQVEGLRVIARTSAFSFKGTSADISTIGRKLGVSSILEGSVRKAGDRLRISAQLVDVAGGHHLWSEVYDRSLDDVFQIQDEIARTIVTTIKPKLLGDSSDPLVVRPTESREAYELYLRAADRIARFSRWDTRTAIEMLRDATAIDPHYADAWARLALACAQMGFSFDPDARWHESAEAAVRRAFELDPDNAGAHFALGRILWSPRGGFQHRPALRALHQCLVLQPGANQPRIWQSMVFLHVGMMTEAREGLVEALAAEPENPATLSFIGHLSLFQGRYEEGEEHMKRAHRADPTLWHAHAFLGPVRLYRNDLAGAEAALRTARQMLGDDPLLDSCDALLWAKRGEPERAGEALARAARDRPSRAHRHHAWHFAASACAELGRASEAIANLRTAAETGFPNHPLFCADPHLVGLRDAPEMKSLLGELERDCASFRAEFGRH